MLDILLRLCMGFGAGGVAIKLATDRAAQRITGSACHVVVPRQNVGDYIKGSSGIWSRGDRKEAVRMLANDPNFIRFAYKSGSKRIRILPPLNTSEGQVRVPEQGPKDDLNVFIFSTPEKSTSIQIPATTVRTTFSGRALRPTGGGEIYYDMFGHPLVQRAPESNSLYFLGLLSPGIHAGKLTSFAQILNQDDDELQPRIISLQDLGADDLFWGEPSERDRLLWTNELRGWIVSEAQQVKGVASVNFPGSWEFNIVTEPIVYKGRDLGRFMIYYSLELQKPTIVRWNNLTYSPGLYNGFGRPPGHAPLVDKDGMSYLHVALVDIPMALAEFRIKDAVRLSIRVLKSSLDTQSFNIALASYPLVE